ncbi:MAG: AAA-like domain-containing protein, partial [Lentisphaeria bacterium]|nr:AAA-like domain-containing protein [Lentisphaeria bacterium]
MLGPEHRLRHVLRLVDEEKYFTIHAGRQVGKTTMLQWLVDHFNAGDRYTCLWVDLQTAREIPDPAEALPVIMEAFERGLQWAWPDEPMDFPWEPWMKVPRTALSNALRFLSDTSPHPLIVLFDEADSLVGATMVTFLTQLRDGYLMRGRRPFPHTVALVGQRQVRDYVFRDEDRRAVAWLGSTSPFNITAEAATLRMFTEEETGELLAQHSDKTGQKFSKEAVQHLFYLSQGHPWLINAIADQVVNRDVEDRSVEVTKEHIESAKETIIRERRSHIDSLLARLREERVRRIIDPMIAGVRVHGDVLDDDFSYVVGLGLVTRPDGRWQVAPVYREIII